MFLELMYMSPGLFNTHLRRSSGACRFRKASIFFSSFSRSLTRFPYHKTRIGSWNCLIKSSIRYFHTFEFTSTKLSHFLKEKVFIVKLKHLHTAVCRQSEFIMNISVRTYMLTILRILFNYTSYVRYKNKLLHCNSNHKLHHMLICFVTIYQFLVKCATRFGLCLSAYFSSSFC